MKIDCPHCGVHGSVEDSLAGKKLRCPKCSKVFLLPDDVLPEAGDGGMVRWDCPHCGVPGSVEDSLAGKKLRCPKCSKVFLLSDDVLSEAEDEDGGEAPEDELLDILEEEASAPETGDFLAEEDELLGLDDESEDDSGEESTELEVCSECGESLHPEFLETVGSKRYCALCLPEEAEEGGVDLEAEEPAAADDEGEGIDTDVARALMSDDDEFEGDESLQEVCSVCGEKFHPDFLQEVDSKFYCGLCQPEVIEEGSDEAGEEVAAEATEELALAESATEDSEALVADTDEEELPSSGSDFSVGELIKEAWQKTKGAKGAIWAALIVMYGIVFAVSFGGMFALQGTATQTDPNTAMGISAALQLVSTWLSTLFTGGIMLIGVRRALEQRLSWKMVFAGFAKVFSITISIILQTILIVIGFVLLVLTGIYLTIGYTLTLPLILDKGLGPWEAMEASRKAIHKKWWTVLGLYLVMLLLYAVSAIPLGLGFIWTIPMFFVLIGVLYVRLFGDDSGAVEEIEEVEEEGEEISEEIEQV